MVQDVIVLANEPPAAAAPPDRSPGTRRGPAVDAPTRAAGPGRRHDPDDSRDRDPGRTRPGRVAARATREPLDLAEVARTLLLGFGPAVDSVDDRPVAEAGGLARIPGTAAIPDADALVAGRLADLAHEVRAALALISGYSQSLLHLDLEEAERRNYLEQIPLATARLADLTHEMLGVCVEPTPDVAPTSDPIPLRRLSR